MESTEQTISRLLNLYGDMILRLSFSYLKNMQDAEDVVQEVFIKFMDYTPNFNDSGHEKAWFMKTSVNLCKNKLKSYGKKHTSFFEEEAQIPICDSYDEGSDVTRAVLSLPEQYRVAVHLYYYEGYRTAEIAKFLHQTQTTVRSHLFRARKLLKQILKEDYDFDEPI